MISQAGSEGFLIGADKRGPFFRDDAFHSVREHRLEIGDMADDLQSAPLPGYRPGLQLLAIHSCNGTAKHLRTSQIFLGQLRKRSHGACLLEGRDNEQEFYEGGRRKTVQEGYAQEKASGSLHA